MRKWVSLKILRSIYFAIFDSYLSYSCLVWAQNCSTIQRIIILQKKAIRVINIQPRNFHTTPLFKQNSILKFQDNVCSENIWFVNESLNNLSPSVYNTWFSFSSDQHNYETSSFSQGNLIKHFYKTKRYGKYSITVSAVDSWNKIQNQLKDIHLEIYPPTKLKQLPVIFILNYINNSLIMQKLYLALIRGLFFLSGFWRLTGQQGKGRDHFLFYSPTSTGSRTFRHLLATLYVRWLSHIFILFAWYLPDCYSTRFTTLWSYHWSIDDVTLLVYVMIWF